MHSPKTLTTGDYQVLARFRYLIRQFLQFSETAAIAEGLEPQQHQMMLVIQADPETQPTIGRVAEQLLIRHHSAVGLADRLASHGLIERIRDDGDRRQVRLRLTPKGEVLLERLTQAHQSELRKLGPKLVQSLASLLVDVDHSWEVSAR